MINAIKKRLIYLRNILLWLTPFLISGLILFLFVFSLDGDLSKYIELLEVLIWPITLFAGLFFFRKVVTYMFFSMDEFNFFGAKGDLKNVQELINEKVEKKFADEKKDREIIDRMKEMEEKLNSTSASDEENRQLIKDIYKIYKDYKKETQERIDNLMTEITELREKTTQNLTAEAPSLEIGSGEMIQGPQPTNQ